MRLLWSRCVAPYVTSATFTTDLCCRNVSTSAVRGLDQKWRQKRGLPENPNVFGPLTNLPDYTYLDGRPTPLGSNQKKRIIKQQEIAAKIVTLSGELDFAKKRYARIQIEEKERAIKPNPLKEKGIALLQKKPKK